MLLRDYYYKSSRQRIEGSSLATTRTLRKGPNRVLSPQHQRLVNEMAVHLNLFRVIADLSHTASKCILIWAIHSNKSAEGKNNVSSTGASSISSFLMRPHPLFESVS